MASKKWVVVGGGGDGILVRKGKDTKSAAEDEKLATGAVVTAKAIESGRMNFSKVSGGGPSTGWVSIQASGKDLLVEVNEAEGGQAADALTKVVDGAIDADDAMAIFKSLSNKHEKAAGTLLTTIPELYLQDNNPDAAADAAQEAVKLFEGKGDKVGLAAAYTSLARAQLSQELGTAALSSATEASSIFKELGDTEGHASVLQTNIRILIASGKASEAVDAAKEVVRLVKLKKDAKATGAALIQLSEVCMDVNRSSDAVRAALDAQACFSASGDKKEEAKAYIAAACADMKNENGEAVRCARAAADIFVELGDAMAQANAVYTAAIAHVAAIAIKQRTCLLPCQANTRGALDAAQEASNLYSRLGNREGAELAMQAMRTVLAVNGEASAALTDGAFDTDALMSGMGKVTYAKGHQVKEKTELFKRSSFSWREAINGYHLTILWEHKVEGTGQSIRGGYRAVLTGTAPRHSALPLYHTIKSQFATSPDEGPLMIHMSAINSGWAYGTAMIAAVAAISAALACRMHTVVFIVVDEAANRSKDEQDTVHQMYLSATVLSIIRSARLEAPMMNIGFLAMDAATWHMHRAEAIAALPDVLQSEETEIHFHRGTPVAPTIVNRPVEPMVDTKDTYDGKLAKK
jgi:hypothetical protein